MLFFTLSSMRVLDPMYQFSLAWYLRVYTSSFLSGLLARACACVCVCVRTCFTPSTPAPHSKDVPTRVKHLTDNFTLVLLADVSRSLFAKDKVCFHY